MELIGNADFTRESDIYISFNIGDNLKIVIIPVSFFNTHE